MEVTLIEGRTLGVGILGVEVKEGTNFERMVTSQPLFSTDPTVTVISVLTEHTAFARRLARRAVCLSRRQGPEWRLGEHFSSRLC